MTSDTIDGPSSAPFSASATSTPVSTGSPDPRATPALSVLEARVLGVLIEKEHTVPDTYPLSLNALTAGCNQKSSRDPVMNATEAEVGQAIDRLRGLSLVVESSGGRVMRYAHNTGRVLQVPSAAVALLATLALRGPQTAGEIRINCERLHRFADISAVEAYLHELAARPAGALVAELPRQPGSRENRWMHLLCGAPSSTVSADHGTRESAWERGTAGVDTRTAGLDARTAGLDARAAELDARVAALEARIAELESEVARLRAEVEGPPGSHA